MKSNTPTINTGTAEQQVPAFAHDKTFISDSQISSALESGSIETPASNVTYRRYGFTIGAHHFLVPQGMFCELLVDIDISPLPNSPKHVIGLCNHRGNIVPIYSLAPLLGLQTKKIKYAYLLGQPQDGAAIVIDEKPSSIDLSTTTRTPTSTTTSDFIGSVEAQKLIENCTEHYYSLGNTTWRALNPDALFRSLATPSN